MSKIEVLVAAMNQSDFSIVREMNLRTNTVIINQCKIDKEESKTVGKNKFRMYSYNERGLAKSRNRALSKSNADICVIADDDVIYIDNYEEIIKQAFEEQPDADLIIFNIKILNPNRQGSIIRENKRVNFWNYMKYGSCRIAFKRESLEKNNIKFDELFGAGACYTSGEDTIFMNDCLRKGLRIYTNTSTIAFVKQETSSWFNGYNEKYFFDKGAIFARIDPKLYGILNIQFAMRKFNVYKKEISLKNAWRNLNLGSRKYLNK